jgi:hypothetical protein
LEPGLGRIEVGSFGSNGIVPFGDASGGTGPGGGATNTLGGRWDAVGGFTSVAGHPRCSSGELENPAKDLRGSVGDFEKFTKRVGSKSDKEPAGAVGTVTDCVGVGENSVALDDVALGAAWVLPIWGLTEGSPSTTSH